MQEKETLSSRWKNDNDSANTKSSGRLLQIHGALPPTTKSSKLGTAKYGPRLLVAY